MQEVKIGTYTGTGAVQTILTGFQPDFIRVNTKSEIWQWTQGLNSTNHAIGSLPASAVVDITANGFGVMDDPNVTYTGKGFTVGASVAQNTVKYAYIAMRNG